MAEIARLAVILIAEDEPFVRMVAADLLAEEGRIVLEAGSAEEALEVIAAAGHIDLLFTDINMPGELDGLDLARIAYDRQNSLKIVVTSGANNLSDKDIPNQGVFISKPYAAGELARVIKAKLSAPS